MHAERPRPLAVAIRPWLLLAAVAANAGDWTQWGGRNERNFVSDETGLPEVFAPPCEAGGGTNAGAEAAAAGTNLLWTAKLGTITYSTPAIADGRVYLGTNDEHLDHPRVRRSGGGLVLCLDAASGRRLWQLPVPRLRTRNKLFNFDDLKLGICSSPAVVGDRLYLVSSRGEALCLDTHGQADGNDGPYTGEARYIADTAERPDKPGRFAPADGPPPPEPADLGQEDGDIVWCFDFLRDLDVWAQDAVDCSPLVLGDHVWLSPSVGVDRSHKFIPSPHAPNLMVLDRRTGALLATNAAPYSAQVFHGEWSSPSLLRAGGRDLVAWGGGDGVCRAYDTRFEAGTGGAPGVLTEVWRFDANPPHNKVRDGRHLPYNKNHEGPSEIIATPVFDGRRIFVGVGQDSRHGPGPGCFSCIDPGGRGDITRSGMVWQSFDVQRSFSSAAVAAGLAVVADYAGIVHCFDAATGRRLWTHDLDARVFGSPLAADGRVYIGDEKGYVTVFALAREKRILHAVRLDSAVYTTPVAAGGTLFLAASKTLYAFRRPGD